MTCLPLQCSNLPTLRFEIKLLIIYIYVLQKKDEVKISECIVFVPIIVIKYALHSWSSIVGSMA